MCIRDRDLAVRLADMDVKIVSGMEGLLELARMPQTDILVTAVVGMIGIRPTMEGIKAGKDIALANKETLVTAGHLIIPMAKEHGVQILPVDSEHLSLIHILQNAAAILDLQRNITAILLLQSVVIRIFRFTGSLRISFGDVWKEREKQSIIKRFWKMWHASPVCVSAGRTKQRENLTS